MDTCLVDPQVLLQVLQKRLQSLLCYDQRTSALWGLLLPFVKDSKCQSPSFRSVACRLCLVSTHLGQARLEPLALQKRVRRQQLGILLYQPRPLTTRSSAGPLLLSHQALYRPHPTRDPGHQRTHLPTDMHLVLSCLFPHQSFFLARETEGNTKAARASAEEPRRHRGGPNDKSRKARSARKAAPVIPAGGGVCP